MKICFFISDITSSGGTERISFQVANSLVDNGHSVCFLSLKKTGDSLKFYLSDKINQYVLLNDFSIKKLPKFVTRYRAFLKNNDIDIIIDVDSVLTPYTYLATLNLNIKHIVWEHFNSTINLGIKRRDWGRWLGAKFADKCVVLTKEDQSFWQKKYNANNVVTIYNPVTIELSKEIVPIKDKKIILAVGRLNKQKGFDLLLEAWNLLPVELKNTVTLRIVGEGEEREHLERYIKQHNLTDSVELYGYSHDIETLYQQAYAYILSSRFEGFVLTLTEAMGAGLPVISFDCPCGPKELIINNSGLLVKFGDIHNLAGAIENITTDEKMRNELAFNALQRSFDFSEDKILPRWHKLIQVLYE